LGPFGDGRVLRRRDERGHVKGRAAERSHREDEADEKDEAADAEEDRDRPGRADAAFTVTEDPDHEKGRDEGEFVEGVEEKEIGRGEGSDRTAPDEEKREVVKTGTALDRRFLRRHKNRGDEDEGGEEHEDEADAVDSKSEAQFRKAWHFEERAGARELHSALLTGVEVDGAVGREEEHEHRSSQRGEAGGRPEADGERGEERQEDEEFKSAHDERGRKIRSEEEVEDHRDHGDAEEEGVRLHVAGIEDAEDGPSGESGHGGETGHERIDEEAIGEVESLGHGILEDADETKVEFVDLELVAE
jgi:hypothetical protein